MLSLCWIWRLTCNQWWAPKSATSMRWTWRTTNVLLWDGTQKLLTWSGNMQRSNWWVEFWECSKKTKYHSYEHCYTNYKVLTNLRQNERIRDLRLSCQHPMTFYLTEDHWLTSLAQEQFSTGIDKGSELKIKRDTKQIILEVNTEFQDLNGFIN